MALIKAMFSYSVIADKSLILCRYLAIIAAIAAPASTAITSIACIAMLLTWLVSGQVWQSLKISASQPAGKMLLLFFSWLIIGCLYADTSWAEKLTTLSSWKKLFYTFVLFGLFYQTEWKKRFVYFYLAAMCLAAIIAIPLWAFNLQLSQWGAGIFMTNYSSQSLAFLAAALCCVFLLKQELGPQKKRFLIAMIGIFLFNILFVSQSRSGYLALPVAAVFAFVNLYGYKKLPHILGITAVAVALAVLTSGTLQKRIKLGLEEKVQHQTKANQEFSSVATRLVFAENSWELIQQQPILGYGTSSFKSVFSPHVAKKYQDWRGQPATDPHNQYLFVWFENGLIGLLIFLAYIYTAIRQGAKQQPYGAIATGVLIAIATSSLFNSNFKTFPEGHLLAFFVGCLLAQQPVSKGEEHSA